MNQPARIQPLKRMDSKIAYLPHGLLWKIKQDQIEQEQQAYARLQTKAQMPKIPDIKRSPWSKRLSMAITTLAVGAFLLFLIIVGNWLESLNSWWAIGIVGFVVGCIAWGVNTAVDGYE